MRIYLKSMSDSKKMKPNNVDEDLQNTSGSSGNSNKEVDLLMKEQEALFGGNNLAETFDSEPDDNDTEPEDNEDFEDFDDGLGGFEDDEADVSIGDIKDDIEDDDLTHTLVNHLREALGLVPLKKKNVGSNMPIANRCTILTGFKLFNRLIDWFPKFSHTFLKDVSESHAVNKNNEAAVTDLYCRIFDGEDSITKIDKDGSKKTKFPFVRCRLFPPEKTSTVFDLEFDNLFRLANEEYIEKYNAGSGLWKLASGWSNTPPELSCVDYIYNADLARQFEETKKDFEAKGLSCRERRLFHGTHNDSIYPIISGNFDIAAKRVNGTKAMVHGRGIYFSDYPTFSLSYGKSLLLCRVLVGKETNKGGQNYDRYIYNTYAVPDSRLNVKDNKDQKSKDIALNRHSIYVVRETRQILPCYIIHVKQNDASTMEKNVHRANIAKWLEGNRGADGAPPAPGNMKKFGILVSSRNKNEMGINTLIGDCVICLEPLSSENTNGNDNGTPDVSPIYTDLSKDFVYKLSACKHTFHILCVRDILSNQDADEYLECPLCKSISGKRVGTQPPDGTMTISKRNQKLPGFESDSQGMIIVRYDFSPGIQGPKHPNPGQPYSAPGFPRTGYFPDNEKGRKVVELMKVAFDRRLVFTVGKSVTSGAENVITWNGIHHKTSISGGNWSYPDDKYLDNVQGELKGFGITERDLQASEGNEKNDTK